MRTILVTALVFSGLCFGEVTYSKEISRIVQARCQTCHREGDIAPFTLANYKEVVFHSRAMERALRNHSMPPWKPADGFGEFSPTFQIPEAERQMILDWMVADMPEGDPRDLPTAQPVTGEWPLGAPDKTLSMLGQFTPAPTGDTYRCFIIPTGLNDTQMLRAIDILPGARTIVHHVILFQDTKGTTENLDSRDGQPGYNCFGGPGLPLDLSIVTNALGAWAPGQRTQFLPDGIGIGLQKGAKIIMQVHYHPHHGTMADSDQTRIGLYYTKAPVTQRLFQIPLVNQNFTIPAGAKGFDVNASLTVLPLFDAKVIWVYPHMHLLGRQIQVDVQKPGGTMDPLIREDDWSFNWQGAYTLKNSLPIRAGSTVRLKCTFDNSADNLQNPNDPPKPVSWGEFTTDEMCLAFIGVTFDNNALITQLLNVL